MLPLAAPIMDQIHQRYLQFFVEQDVVGHMESDLDGTAVDLGRMRVAIAFADLAGYTRMTEEEGELEAVDAVERFVEAVEVTLPDEARIIKTIGDEVMIVGSDAAALTDWAVGFQAMQTERPLPRIGVHYGVALYRDGDYYGRDINIAAACRRARPGARCWSRGRSSRWPGAHLEFERIGEVTLKGFSESTEVFLARQRPGGGRMTDDRGRGPGAGPARRRAVPWWSCSRAGATPPACSTSRRGSPGRPRSAPCTSTTGCAAGADADERHCAGAVRAPRRPARRPPAAGAAGTVPAAATSRRGRATSATARPPTWRWRASADVAVGHTRSDQVETILYRLASSPEPPRAARDARAATARSCARCWRSRASRRAPTAPARGLRWRDDETNDTDAYARNRIRRELVPALSGSTRRRRTTCWRWPRSCATRPRCSTSSSSATLDGRAEIPLDAPARAAAGAAPAGGAAPGRRRRRAARPPGWPAAPRRWRRCRRTARSALDLPSGVRATARDGVVTFGRTPGAGSEHARA